ncbi:MAG TPA: DUF5989 family protein [Candidatus Sumerlaeota bacterium]|nr:DUF5989 family protein [Candidatus Sumerlaeota bacterium]
MSRWLPLAIFLVILGLGAFVLYKYRRRFEILMEFFEFLRVYKLWWIMPIVIVLLVLSVFIVFFQSGAVSAVIYALF